MKLKLLFISLLMLLSVALLGQSSTEVNFVRASFQDSSYKYMKVMSVDTVPVNVIIKFLSKTPQSYIDFTSEIVADYIHGKTASDVMLYGFPPIEMVEYVFVIVPNKN